jgi:threonine dehydrogenase-like Zn-dependent dehydrogenase
MSVGCADVFAGPHAVGDDVNQAVDVSDVAGGKRLRVLIVGAGVIGTVYGAHLACAGHAASVATSPAPATCASS